MRQMLWEKAISLKMIASLEEEFLAEAIFMAVFLINHAPSIVIDVKIPEEIWKKEC